MNSLRNLVSRRANNAMLDRETDNIEASNQIEISVVSWSKQDEKAEKPNQGLKRPSQIENKEENQAKTQEEPGEVAGQSDPLNIVFSYFDSRFQEIQNQIRKNKDKKPAEKKQDLFINVQNLESLGTKSLISTITIK